MDQRKLKTLKTLADGEMKERNVKQEQALYDELKESGVGCETICHFLFKALPLFLFLMSPLLAFMPSIVCTELVVLLQMVDFWYTKNVSGRRMVGLRWWVNFDESGEQEWKFQCRVNEDMVDPTASKVFWFSMYLCGGLWVILLFFNVIKLSLLNTALCAIGAAVVGTNLFAFYKCSNAQKRKTEELVRTLGADVTRQMFNGSIISRL